MHLLVHFDVATSAQQVAILDHFVDLRKVDFQIGRRRLDCVEGVESIRKLVKAVKVVLLVERLPGPDELSLRHLELQHDSFVV